MAAMAGSGQTQSPSFVTSGGRCSSESGRHRRRPWLPTWANSRLMHCSKLARLFDHVIGEREHLGSATAWPQVQLALGQDQNPATPKDVIFARKTLMNSIGTNMYAIDEMLETAKIDLVTGRANAESISAKEIPWNQCLRSNIKLIR
jgi:hypothetical protein